MNRTTVAAAVGFVATAVAVALLVVPETLLAVAPVDSAVSALSERDPRVLLLIGSAVVGLLGLAVSRGRPREIQRGSGPTRLVGEPPETARSGRRSRPGAALDEQLALAVDGDETAAVALRETLRRRAVRTIATDPSVDTEAARRAVETGAWTDDALVAAYLGSETLPLSARLREWLDPGAEQRRRVRRTVTAIERAGPRR